MSKIDGVLYYKDKPQALLAIDTEAGIYNITPQVKKPKYPFEFRHGVFNKASVELFLTNRVFPETRQDKHALLKSLGLTRYNKNSIARKMYYCCHDDAFWIRPFQSGITYQDILHFRTRPNYFE